MRRSIASAAILVGLTLPRVVDAGVIVSYAFDSVTSTLSITSPAMVSIPPQGTFDGIIAVTFSTDIAGAIVNGPATLDDFTLSTNLNISTTLFSLPVTLVGPANAELETAVAGNLTGNTLSFGSAPGSFHAFGSLACGGSPCAASGFTTGVPRAFDGSASVPLPEMTLASIHGTLAGLTFSVGGLSLVASLEFNGTETGREIVPEPSDLILVGLIAGALLVARRR